jgi:hypothetical protein
MADDLNKGLMQEYYIPKSENEKAAITFDSYIFFFVFIAIAVVLTVIFG